MRHALVLIVLVAGFLAVPAAFPWLAFVFTLVIAKGFAALGVAILLRAGLISIGHALFYAIGAYTVGFLSSRAGVDLFLPQLLAAALVSGVLGLLVGLFMVRYRGIFFAMLNLAVSMVGYTLLAKLYSLTGGTDGLSIATPRVLGMTLTREAFESVLLYGGLALAIVLGFLAHRYLKSPMGEALAAVESNEIRLEYLGVSVPRVLLFAYVGSAVLAGVGGAIHALAIGHITPDLAYWTTSGQLVLVAVLGGIGGVVGPFVGALFLESVRAAAAIWAPDVWNLIIGAGLLIVIFFLPRGLYGLIERTGGRAKR
ncbi:branched-chain amino acid ABC transporter permease [Acuticoccus sp. I52.16.1]|uniref:branched-chain amino acid ABC transporter permease n=1 Tax=Acuticoccus sp. I52.16.1 TaxID=2928472 RepID=UPI001FD31444|nr:branched-chain amino acid ABC transporter permease [Acuticoccus sp. I52.16.1]UOM33903.1 branched-chain amino acid ABC transporter permease [Acuticoccus sp. I52.16.1]